MNQPSKDIDRGASADGQPSYEELRDIAFRIAVEAAALIRRERAEIGDLQAVTETKSSAVDPVTQVDKHSEEFITGESPACGPRTEYLEKRVRIKSPRQAIPG